MNEKIKNILGISIIATLVTFIITLITTMTLINSSIDPAANRTFSVSAEGEVQTTPDIATFSFSVITEGDKDVATLQKENTEKMNNIIEAVKARGVDTEDIKTTNYNVSPRYSAYVRCIEEPCKPREIIGYTISQNILVKVKDFAITGALLTDITNAGANNVQGPNFAIEDPASAQAEAREKAIAKAKEKAEQMAKAGDFKVGKLISINDGTSHSSMYAGSMMLEDSVSSMKSVSSAPSIEPGSDEVKVTVTLTFEIK